MSDDYDVDDTDTIVCPWCLKELENRWYDNISDFTMTCPECGGKLRYKPKIKTTYSTIKIKEASR